MDDLISRQAAIAYAISGRTREFDCDKWIRVSEVCESLKTMPSAQTERKNGKWIVSESDTGKLKTKCSVCGAVYSNYLRLILKYCPNCGAKMEG